MKTKIIGYSMFGSVWVLMISLGASTFGWKWVVIVATEVALALAWIGTAIWLISKDDK